MSYQEAAHRIEVEAQEKTGILNLSWLDLEAIPANIRDLNQITTLDLSFNKITDASILGELPNITTLDLSENRLNDIGFIQRLTNLTHLSLNKNKISNIRSLGGLENLMSLSLNDNRISEINILSSLTNLNILSLNENKISDISSLENLNNINSLSLNSNKIIDISPLLHFIERPLSIGMSTAANDINLADNPLSYPPPEIVEQGRDAVLNYFNQLKEQEQDYLFEAKLLILGEGGAGKTTFSRKIRQNEAVMPKDEDTTKGIDVYRWKFDLAERDLNAAGVTNLLKVNDRRRLLKKKFYVNLWDFGGQEIYHATHRFFLSGRSLYVLLADGRKQETDFNYWFNIIEQLGGESPLIVVVNEKHGQTWRIDEQGLKGRFSFFRDSRFLDLAENNDFTKLEDLRETIRTYITRLPHIGDPLPESWTAIRKDLAEEPKPFISLEGYLDICRKNNMTDLRQALLLSQYFHDIGVFLHYQKDQVLKNRIFLDPNWTTHTVYKLLNDQSIKAKMGRFSQDDVERIWQEEEVLLIHSELLKLLERFKLAYCIDDTSNYIAPEYLPDQKPYDQWEFKKDLLMLSYEFDAFMPKGLMNDLIVELHRFIPNHEQVWRRGVVLKRNKAWAEITQAYGNEFRFDIKVFGQDKKEFLIIISDVFDEILENLPKLKVEKLVPCNCERCVKTNDKYFYKLSDLKRRLSHQRDTIDCPKNADKPVPISPLLEETIIKKTFGMDKVRSLIASNCLEEALNILQYRNSHEAAQLRRRWIQVENERHGDRISFDEYQISINRITEQMLKMSVNSENDLTNHWTGSTAQKKPFYRQFWDFLSTYMNKA